MNLNQIITITRQNHYKKTCIYGECKCFQPVHDAMEEIRRLAEQNKRKYK